LLCGWPAQLLGGARHSDPRHWRRPSTLNLQHSSMKTTMRYHHVARAKYEIAALLCLSFLLTGCKKEAPPSSEKALVRAPVVELRENDRSHSKASDLNQVRAEGRPEPQRDRADNDEQLMAIEKRTEIAAVEREERLLLEAIIAAKVGSALVAETGNLKKAERALERATDRYMVGAGTQTDVLNAQTTLTEARGSYIHAL